MNICKPADGILYSTDSISWATGYVWTIPGGVTITHGFNTNHIRVSFTSSAVSGSISVYGTNSSGNGGSSTLAITVNPYPEIPTITPPGPLSLCAGSVNLSVTPQPGSTYCWYSTDPAQMKSWQYAGIPGFSADKAEFVHSVYSPTGQLHVVFADYSHSQKTSVMKFDGTSWQYVGSPGFSLGSVTYPKLAFSPSGQLYAGFKDSGLGCKSTVMKFNGTNWVFVGSPLLSVSGDYPTVALHPNGQPSLAYSDYNHLFKASVKQCQGSTWVYLGSPGFSPTGGAYESLVFDSSGHAFVSYQEGVYNYQATVMKFSGSNWAIVGSQAFSTGPAVTHNLVFSPTGQLYIAFSELLGGNSRVTIKKFDGTNWINVGPPGFSPAGSSYPSLAFGPSGQPFVAYQDHAYSLKATVMKFVSPSWVAVGSPGFSSGAAYNTSLTFNPYGEPFVAFQDYGHDEKISVMHYSLSCLEDSSVYPTSIPGTYAMTITNQAGCAVTSSNQVTVTAGSLPVPTITGIDSLCVNSGFYNYTTETGMFDYQWNVSSGGIITYGTGTNMIQVSWIIAGQQTISVTYTDSLGCSAVSPASLNIIVNPLPDQAGTITGDTTLCAGDSSVSYVIAPITNAVAYVWTLPSGATITSGNGTNAITVNFATNSTSGDITVYGNNLCGNGLPSQNLHITVNPIPDTPTITQHGDTLTSSAPFGNQWYFNGMLLANDTNQIYLVSPYLPGYYWTQVTVNECVSDTSNHIYCNTVGIEDNMKSGLSIYPNPVTEILYIEFNDADDNIKFVEIYTSTGIKIFEFQTRSRTITINTINIPKGIYFIKVKTGNSSSIGKFIVL